MAELFSDLPEAIENTAEIARRCAFRVEKRKPILPRFDTKRGRDEAAELKAQAEAGLKERLKALGDRLAAPSEEYEKRLAYELDVITQMQFPGYFLIVSDFIKWAKSHGIPVGPGRGSGAGSVVAWALTITDLDPLRWGLLFERFLNPERVSMPDFDIDFCQERRGEVIDYVKNKYGEDRVAHIITFGTLQARAVLRDVGRVMQLPFGQVDKLAKLVPANPANPVTLAQAMEIEPKLQEARKNEAEVRELIDTALELEGLYRNASTHAAGVVIGDRPLIELVALYRDPRADIAGHPVQHEMGRSGGPGEVRLPRPEDAHRHRPRREIHPKRAAIEIDLDDTRLRRRSHLQADAVGPDLRRVPARRPGHARHAAQGEADQPRRRHRAHLALSPRPDEEHRPLRQREARPRSSPTICTTR